MGKGMRGLWMVLGVFIFALGPAFGIPLTTNYGSYDLFGGAGGGGYTTSGLYDPIDPYMVGAQPWVARLSPVNALYLNAPTQNFLNVLNAAYMVNVVNNAATNPLSNNSLELRTYDVLGTAPSVGAEFHLSYLPGANDPTTDLHWIQVYTNNHNIDGFYGATGHGTAGNNIDNAVNGHLTPYYDHGGAATGGTVAANNPIFFYDFPSREGNAAHNPGWVAELWLVQGPSIAQFQADQTANNNSNITLLGGVKWGWINYPVPEPASVILMGIGLLAIATRKYKHRYNS